MNARAFVVHLSHFCRSAYSGLGWTLLYLGLIGSPMRSAESPQRDYDLPVGDAANTLRLFVEQSGEQVLYLVNSVRTVKTNAVRGRYTALEAINRMLDRTPLIVVQDVRTGALMVKRSSQEVDTPNPDHLYPPANDSPKEPSKTMKRKNPFALLGAWIALALAPSPAAQAADNPPAGAHRETGTGTITGRVQNVATKQYLNNARVSIEGTQLVTFTDSFGTYRLVGAPSGPVVLEVFYTGLDTSRTTVNVPANGTVEQSVELFSVARYGQSPDTVNLDPFLVSSNRETNAEAIAINEQRFAPNIKNVMSTESLGNVVGNSVGEFLKFIPGLTAEYGGEPIFEVSVRGIGGGMTSFTADGAPMVSVNMWLTAGRTFNIDSLSLNDISRIEVTKVPTPSSPADSLAGSVNVISKSAFERDSAQLKVGVSLVGNSENLHLRRIPYSYTDKKTLATRPSFDFDYTLPIGKKFGIVLTGMRNDRFHEQHLSNMVYATSGTGTGASFSRPYLQQYNLYDGPKTITRETLSLKADWRVSEHGTLSIKGQWNRFETNIGTLIWNPTAGAVGTPTIEGGIPLSYGPDFTLGATGRGDSNFINSSESNNGGARLFGLTYKFNDGTWKAEAGVSYSKSDWLRDNFSGGHFNSIRMALRTPARVEFRDNTADHPGSIKAFGNDNQEIDLYNIDNYRVTTATDDYYSNDGGVKSANLRLERAVDRLSFPAWISAGAYYRLQTMDLRRQARTWTYNGVNGDLSPRPYLMQVYNNQDSYWGYKNLPFLSPRLAYAAYLNNPALFTQTQAQMVAAESSRMTQSEYIQEAVSAYYLQFDANLLQNRLRVLTGVRFERTVGEGEGSRSDPAAVYVRHPNGTFARDEQGNRIRRLEAGAVGSMDELRVIQQERATKSGRTYDGYYPSLHLNYSVTDNFLLRAAYARTYGRPNFSDIVPRTVISERDLSDEELNDPNVVKGTLTVRNPSLRPWTADNFDLSAEYYSPHGGVFSAGVFVKEIINFFGDNVKLATPADLEELGLDPAYVGWNLSTKFNAGDARISGAEFNIRHSLQSFGDWGKGFTVFANFTKLKLEGHQQASFTSFIPESGNWGGSYSRNRLTILARWNYRGLDKRTAQPARGPNGYSYFKARVYTDLSVSYQLTPRWELAISVNNVFNTAQHLLYYGSETPDYARQHRVAEYGTPITIGIKGIF